MAEMSVVFKRPFPEQVAFFRGKLGTLVPTAKWNDLRKSQHDRAFMVAGAAKADLLSDLAGAVDKAIAEGETIASFRKRFGDIVQRHGWHGWTGEGSKAGEAWRTRVIYETNLSTSYAAGRLAQLKAADYPLWMYRHSDAVLKPRPQHQAWDGLTLPPDHAFWSTHSPPNGWGCGCRIVGVRSPAQAKRIGGDPDKQLPPGWDKTDPKTGELSGIDKGWGYQPGETALDTIRTLTPKLNQLPPQPSVALIQDWLKTSAFAEWLAKPVGNWPLVRLADGDAQRLGARNTVASMSPDTAKKQVAEHPELTPTEYVTAQQVVDAPTNSAVDGRSLIFIREEGTADTGGYVLVVKTTRTGQGLFVTSYRRLHRDDAMRDAEIRRLLKKGGGA